MRGRDFRRIYVRTIPNGCTWRQMRPATSAIHGGSWAVLHVLSTIDCAAAPSHPMTMESGAPASSIHCRVSGGDTCCDRWLISTKKSGAEAFTRMRSKSSMGAIRNCCRWAHYFGVRARQLPRCHAGVALLYTHCSCNQRPTAYRSLESLAGIRSTPDIHRACLFPLGTADRSDRPRQAPYPRRIHDPRRYSSGDRMSVLLKD